MGEANRGTANSSTAGGCARRPAGVFAETVASMATSAKNLADRDCEAASPSSPSLKLCGAIRRGVERYAEVTIAVRRSGSPHGMDLARRASVPKISARLRADIMAFLVRASARRCRGFGSTRRSTSGSLKYNVGSTRSVQVIRVLGIICLPASKRTKLLISMAPWWAPPAGAAASISTIRKPSVPSSRLHRRGRRATGRTVAGTDSAGAQS